MVFGMTDVSKALLFNAGESATFTFDTSSLKGIAHVDRISYTGTWNDGLMDGEDSYQTAFFDDLTDLTASGTFNYTFSASGKTYSQAISLTGPYAFNGDAYIRITVLNGSIAFPNPVLAGYFQGSVSTVLLKFIQSNLSEVNSGPVAMLLFGTGLIWLAGLTRKKVIRKNAMPKIIKSKMQNLKRVLSFSISMKE